MKKLASSVTLLLIILALLCSAASADTITAMATEINPEHLEKVASYARILGYSKESNTLSMELIAPELFAQDEVEALELGDSIFTNGHEVQIKSIEVTAWRTYLINDQEAFSDSIFLQKDLNGNYRADREDGYVWNTVAVIECPVKDSLLCLNFIDDQTGDTLELPCVLTGHELMTQVFTECAAEDYFATWASDWVYVVFDGEANLAMICRCVVPWYPFSFSDL